MKYYSTNGKAPMANLEKAVVKGLAEDRGLYMPEEIKKLPKAFFDDMPKMRFQDIAFNVASAFFGDDVDLVCCSISCVKAVLYMAVTQPHARRLMCLWLLLAILAAPWLMVFWAWRASMCMCSIPRER